MTLSPAFGTVGGSRTPSSKGSTCSSRGVSPFTDNGEDIENGIVLCLCVFNGLWGCDFIVIPIAILCTVTHVESPSEFWLQRNEDLVKLDTLNKFIAKHCSTNKKEPLMKTGD